jgi:hypothetical protein
LPCSDAGDPAALRASSRSRWYASSTSGESIRDMIASTSSSGARDSACAIASSSSIKRVDVNQPKRSARSAT